MELYVTEEYYQKRRVRSEKQQCYLPPMFENVSLTKGEKLDLETVELRILTSLPWGNKKG